MNPDAARVAQMLAVIGVFLVSLSALLHVVKLTALRVKTKTLHADPPELGVNDSRFERLERAVDAIAVEVERMSEAQRFTAKLMLERGPEKPSTPLVAGNEKETIKS